MKATLFVLVALVFVAGPAAASHPAPDPYTRPYTSFVCGVTPPAAKSPVCWTGSTVDMNARATQWMVNDVAYHQAPRAVSDAYGTGQYWVYYVTKYTDPNTWCQKFKTCGPQPIPGPTPPPPEGPAVEAGRTESNVV